MMEQVRIFFGRGLNASEQIQFAVESAEFATDAAFDSHGVVLGFIASLFLLLCL